MPLTTLHPPSRRVAGPGRGHAAEDCQRCHGSGGGAAAGAHDASWHPTCHAAEVPALPPSPPPPHTSPPHPLLQPPKHQHRLATSGYPAATNNCVTSTSLDSASTAAGQPHQQHPGGGGAANEVASAAMHSMLGPLRQISLDIIAASELHRAKGPERQHTASKNIFQDVFEQVLRCAGRCGVLLVARACRWWMDAALHRNMPTPLPAGSAQTNRPPARPPIPHPHPTCSCRCGRTAAA